MFNYILSFIKRQKLKDSLKQRGIHIDRHVDINNVSIGDFVNLAHHCQVSNSEIGDRTSIGRYSKIQYAKIGKFCSISWDVTIGALEHPMHSVSTHAFSYRKQFGLCANDIMIPYKKINIGNDVWIGCGAIVMPGVKIGDGAVIGAVALVNRDVEAYEIVGGVPAKHLNWRFSNTIRNRLIQCKWWNFSDDVLKNNILLFDPRVDLEDHPEIIDLLEAINKS